MFNNSKWISFPKYQYSRAYTFKKEISLNGEIKKAMLRLSALGVYYAEIDGSRVGDFVLAPGCTSSKRVQAQEYDVTKMLKEKSILKISLGDGWRNGRINWRNRNDRPNENTAIICELEITYKNGDRDIVVSDESWQVCESQIQASDIYDGEIVDVNLEEKYGDALVQDYSRDMIVKQQGEKIVEVEKIRAHKIFTTPKGELVIDFNQNLTGYFEIRTNAMKGEKISLSFAEVLDKDGNFYIENYRSAKAQFEYVCRDGEQSYKPRLTFYGFRYIRVNSFPSDFSPESIVAIVVHSELERTGYLNSSSKLLNKLFDNIIWGQKGNFLDIPTDCPQRDERMGWTGDAQVFVRTATYNYDVEKFFEKWLTDLSLDQYENGGIPHVVPQFWGDDPTSAAWGDASTVCPYQIYLTYGNKAILKKQYPSMVKYVEYMGKITKDKGLWTGCNHYGDWLGLDAPAGSYKGSSREDFIASVFYAYSTSLVIKAGKIIGRKTEKYEKLYDRIIKKIRKTFKTYKTQTECTLALYFDIAEDKASVAKQLADMIIANGTRLQTGFVGTPYLLHALSQNGYKELAYDLLLQEQYPSWLYSVKQGATTIWEHWDGVNDRGEFWSKDMNSFNHYAYGSVADWVYGVALGINTVEDKPGFEEIIIAPQPSNKLGWLKGKIETRRGSLISSWYYEGDKVRYEITTPSRAKIIIEGKEYIVDKGSYIF